MEKEDNRVVEEKKIKAAPKQCGYPECNGRSKASAKQRKTSAAKTVVLSFVEGFS